MTSVLRRIRTKQLLLGAGLLLAAAVVTAWIFPSGEYLFIPHRASPLADRVRVPGERPQPGTGGIYYVDVTVRRAKLLERIVPSARPDGASLVPAHAVVPEGSSFEREQGTALEAMKRSEEVASTVALRAAGYDVVTRPRGVLVEVIATDAPARRVLRAGDVIVSADGHPVRTPAQLRAAMEDVRPGEPVALGVRRDGKTLDLTVKTVADPQDRTTALIGIRVAQDADIVLPLKIEIDLGEVGGPSAGLPFALDVLDELGREVDRGYKVAATGEIEIDGSVRPVGGIKQKTFGVRQAGAEVFLVPAGENAEVARRYAGSLRIVPVENFQQALRVLRTLPPKG